MKPPATNHSSCPRTSNVALVNLVKYSHTVSPSFYFQPLIECESPLPLRNCIKFIKNMYFNWPKLYMFPCHNVLNHVPALSSKVVGNTYTRITSPSLTRSSSIHKYQCGYLGCGAIVGLKVC